MKNTSAVVRWVLAPVLLGLLAPGAAKAAGDAPIVTLPLGEYLELRKRTEAPSVTTIEEVRFTGDMSKAGGQLAVRITGSSSNLMPARPVFEASDSFALVGCEGGAILQSDENGIAVIPQKGHFALDCHLSPRLDSEIEVTVLNALSVKSTVTGAELVVRESGPARKELALTRTSGSRTIAQEGPATASARYRVSVYPDDSRFQYALTFYNPNKTTREFALVLKNHETVQEVRSRLVYDEVAGTVKFKLPPGESQAVMIGKLATAGHFVPLLDSAQQYLLLENHPLLRLQPETRARRISVGETGMNPELPGAFAYYVRATDEFGWATRKLAVFESQGYSVEHAGYRYFVPKQGGGIVEASFTINNQGTPDIPLKVPGRATFLAVDSIPQALYKDDGNQLLVHFPSGRHHLLVQYRPETARGPAGGISETLLKPEAVISEADFTVLVDRGLNLVFGRAMSDRHAFVSAHDGVRAALFFAIFFALFRGMGFSRRDRALGAVGFAAWSWAMPVASGYFVAACAATVVWRQRRWLGAQLMRLQIRSWKQAVGYASIALALWAGGTLISRTGVYQPTEKIEAMNQFAAGDMVAADAAPAGAPAAKALAWGARAKGRAVDKKLREAAPPPPPEMDEGAAPSGQGEAFQGIPAQIPMPASKQVYHFHQNLVEKDTPVSLQLGVVGSWLGQGLCVALLLVSAYALGMNRRRLVAYYVQ